MLKQLATLTQPEQRTHDCQVVKLEKKPTSNGGSQITLHIDDGAGAIKINFFDKHPSFAKLSTLEKGACIRITGTFSCNKWGVESPDMSFTPLTPEQQVVLFSGPPELAAKQARDWQAIKDLIEAMPGDNAYRFILTAFLIEHGSLFRRAAAARGNHHARRGGLVEHVSFMMRNVRAVCENYRDLHPDLDVNLALCATFFHDVGKLWENNYPETGFEQEYQLAAEALGHIVIGIQLVALYWAKIPESARKNAAQLRALQHCIAAHHGTKEFGSPVEPSCIEAVILHFVDNMDAKVNMMHDCYANGERLTPWLVKKAFPLERNLIHFNTLSDQPAQ